MMAPSAGPAGGGPRHRKVGDVMTESVVTADRLTPYKEIARLLAEHRISGMPVLRAGWQVIGVVSEADLLAVHDQAARPGPVPVVSRSLRPRAPGLTLLAGDLMTAPPVTIGPAATLAAAVRLMNTRRVRRLPVTGANRQLIGIVSRRDLLSVFLRPDPEIAHDVRLVLAENPFTRSASVAVSVRHGVVTLAGALERVHGDLALLILDIDGVVDVVFARP
jgi:CBS domain-containing protein